jgi:hypothetical protein
MTDTSSGPRTEAIGRFLEAAQTLGFPTAWEDVGAVALGGSPGARATAETVYGYCVNRKLVVRTTGGQIGGITDAGRLFL